MILEQRNTFKFEGLFVMKPINVKISEPRGNSLKWLQQMMTFIIFENALI